MTIRIVLSLALAALIALPADAAVAPRVGQPAPPFKLKTLDNKPLSLEKYRGKPVYIDFFASWCAPCREETPGIIKLAKQYQKRGLVVIGLDDNENQDRAQGFVDTFKVPFPVGIANQKLLDSYGVLALPVHVFIDRQGNIKEYRLGEMANADIESAIKSIL